MGNSTEICIFSNEVNIAFFLFPKFVGNVTVIYNDDIIMKVMSLHGYGNALTDCTPWNTVLEFTPISDN